MLKPISLITNIQNLYKPWVQDASDQRFFFMTLNKPFVWTYIEIDPATQQQQEFEIDNDFFGKKSRNETITENTLGVSSDKLQLWRFCTNTRRSLSTKNIFYEDSINSTLTNLIPNGDFKSGFNTWNYYYSGTAPTIITSTIDNNDKIIRTGTGSFGISKDIKNLVTIGKTYQAGCRYNTEGKTNIDSIDFSITNGNPYTNLGYFLLSPCNNFITTAINFTVTPRLITQNSTTIDVGLGVNPKYANNLIASILIDEIFLYEISFL